MATSLQCLGQPSLCSQLPSCSSSSQELGAGHLSSFCYHSQGLPRSFTRAANSLQTDNSLRSQGISRRAVACRATSDGLDEVTLLDYGAGNVRSVRNAIKLLGYKVRDVEKPSECLCSVSLLCSSLQCLQGAWSDLQHRFFTVAF